MKKVQILKKELKLNDFTKLKIDASQQKKIIGGEDTVVIDDIIV